MDTITSFMNKNLIRDRESLITAMKTIETPEFLFFWGHRVPKDGSLTKSCLSQWYPAKFKIEGATYFTAEHYMMASKARIFDATDIEQKILSEKDPNKVKSLGRKIKNYDDQVWENHRFDTVVKGNVAKFSQNSKLKNFLTNTTNKILVEASPVDPIWGIGLASDHPDCATPNKWPGLNLLGFALMEARTQILQKQ